MPTNDPFNTNLQWLSGSHELLAQNMDLARSAPPNQQRISNAKTVRSNGTSSGSSMVRGKCTNCHLYHPRDNPCPNLSTEIHVRIALDDVVTLTGGDPEKARQNRQILQNILKAKKIVREARNREVTNTRLSAVSVQPARAPQRPPQQPPQQQARLVPPQQQYAYESSESDDDDSGSEESSNDESGEGSGSGSESEGEEAGDE